MMLLPQLPLAPHMMLLLQIVEKPDEVFEDQKLLQIAARELTAAFVTGYQRELSREFAAAPEFALSHAGETMSPPVRK